MSQNSIRNYINFLGSTQPEHFKKFAILALVCMSPAILYFALDITILRFIPMVGVVFSIIFWILGLITAIYGPWLFLDSTHNPEVDSWKDSLRKLGEGYWWKVPVVVSFKHLLVLSPFLPALMLFVTGAIFPPMMIVAGLVAIPMSLISIAIHISTLFTVHCYYQNPELSLTPLKQSALLVKRNLIAVIGICIAEFFILGVFQFIMGMSTLATGVTKVASAGTVEKLQSVMKSSGSLDPNSLSEMLTPLFSSPEASLITLLQNFGIYYFTTSLWVLTFLYFLKKESKKAEVETPA
jgi:hypothetical protein